VNIPPRDEFHPWEPSSALGANIIPGGKNVVKYGPQVFLILAKRSVQ
jgi:hypothetical protein